MDVQINDIVGRISYGSDILFRVIDIREQNGRKQAILYGEEFRLIADAPFEDLVQVREEERRSCPPCNQGASKINRFAYLHKT